ncbi:hypothetical protein EMIT0194P_180061 [Pseudomonas serbica]
MDVLIRRHGVASTARVVVEDMHLNGVYLKCGDPIQVPDALFGLDPMAIEFERKPVLHVAFGNGPHRCPGSFLARLEIKVSSKSGSSVYRTSNSLQKIHLAATGREQFKGGVWVDRCQTFEALPALSQASIPRHFSLSVSPHLRCRSALTLNLVPFIVLNIVHKMKSGSAALQTRIISQRQHSTGCR